MPGIKFRHAASLARRSGLTTLFTSRPAGLGGGTAIISARSTVTWEFIPSLLTGGNMRAHRTGITSIALACLVLGSIAMAQQPSAPDVAAAGIRETSKLPSAVALKMAMHKLWEDHITYTRNYILSAVAGLPDTESVAKRLLQNQNEIGTAIMPYYGEPAGQKLSALLRNHILIATEV